MARLPPAHGGPKFLMGKSSKGPSSTKTLTTNTHTTTTGVSSVIHDPSVPRTYLFDIYKNEAESHFEIGEYRQAADCYNAAIKLQPNDTAAIIARSRCYCQMGRWKRAMKDCDEALSIDAAFGEALYQKADILYINGNLDLALVYFKRALRQSPDSIRCKNAVHKVSETIQKQGGAAAQRASKLTAVGDLSMFLHSKTKSRKPKESPRIEDENKFELPSAGFRARFNVGPLIRINRKPGVSILRTYRAEAIKSASSVDSAHRDPDEATMRTILGELYGDRKYLKKFQNNLPGGKAERDLTLLADEGLDFLRERTIFWDSLGPLPPPQVPKRSNMRERSFFMTNTDTNSSLIGGDTLTPKVKTPRRGFQSSGEEDISGNPTPRLPPVKEATFTIDDGKCGGDGRTNQDNKSQPQFRRERSNMTTKKPKPSRRGRRLEEAMGLERDVSNVDFKFRSLQPSRSASRMDEGPSMDVLPILRDKTRTKTRMGRTMFVGLDDPAADRKRELTKFINKEMDVIDEAFKTGEFQDCKNKAEICLRTVSSLPGDDDINKAEVMASLHSCLGNAHIALNDFEAALSHHMEALAIGETENLLEVINRSLGHLGRMYIIQKRFNKALEVFARKAPTVVSAEEVAQVFHEIGNCFLALGHLDYARDCGKKALRAALEADIHYFKFQSWVLIAVSESRLKHHDEAYKAFEEALELAKAKDDQESITVILFAMEHLSKTITSIMKKRAMLSERLMSRSKTQTIIDLNKRPHAARLKKKKKRLKRENTDLEFGVEEESAMPTRQNTMMREVTWVADHIYNDEDDNHDNDDNDIDDNHRTGKGGDDGMCGGDERERGDGESPHRRSSVMFEESPRELEPFGDPHLRKQKTKELQVAGVRQHTRSRNGILEAIGSGSGGGSRRGSFGDIERGHQQNLDTPTRLEIHRSPRNCENSSASNRNKETSKMVSPRNTHNDSLSPLTPLKQIHSVTATPRTEDKDSLVNEDGFLSQRGEYFHPSKGSLHTHRGGFHSNRESRADNHDADPESLNSSIVKAGSEADSVHRGGRAKSRNVNMGSLRETPFEENQDNERTSRTRNDNQYCGDEELGDVTGVSSRVLPPMNLSSRMNDLSVTMESPWQDDDVNETPRGNSNDVTPRNRYSRRGKRKTPGRFTRESYYDESGGDVTMGNNDASVSIEHISVSRQHHRKTNIPNTTHEERINARRDVLANKEAMQPDDGAENEFKAATTNQEKRTAHPNVISMERQSSKVAMRVKKNEETLVTLETSKPYRVSSAASNRSNRSAGNGNGAECEKDHNSHNNRKDKEAVSPARSTGSGWEGDVSMEMESTNQGVRKGKDHNLRKKRGGKDSGEGSGGEKSKLDENKVGHERKGKEKETNEKNNRNNTQVNVNDTADFNDDSKQYPMTNDDVTLSIKGGATSVSETTVTTLRAQEVKADVIKNTLENSKEHQQAVMNSKEAYLDHKHATKMKMRDMRELEDIPSASHSSKIADPNNHFNAMTTRPYPDHDQDPALSTSIPFSAVSGQATPEHTKDGE